MSDLNGKIGKVIKIVDEYNLGINLGKQDGIKIRQRFLVYGLSEDDIIDPDSNENLGKLEIVRGTGHIVNVQDRLSLLRSDKKSQGSRVIRKQPWYVGEEEIIDPPQEDPFDDPEVGDLIRPI